MDDTERIAVTDMATMIDSGQAHELLDFVALGPAEHNGRWWYIAADAVDKSYYVPAPPELAERFAARHAQLTRLGSFVNGGAA